MTGMCEDDLLIIGGGPAALSAAINGASEGLRVRIIDNGNMIGGQARESSAIENYPGFPDGITGNELMGSFVRQARKFSTIFSCPLTAIALERDEASNRIIVTTDDDHQYAAKAAILAIGLNYRRLSASNIDPLLGRGVFYGMTTYRTKRQECHYAVIGGGNSAGQAAVNLAKNPKAKVYIIIRKNMEAQMSSYLHPRLREAPNVTIIEGAEVISANGTNHLTGIVIRRDGEDIAMPMHCMLVFIGAFPRTAWLKNTLKLDKDRYILTGTEAGADMPYMTSMRGVFAAGDVRSGSTKRIVAGAGEGGNALQMVHRYLASLEQTVGA